MSGVYLELGGTPLRTVMSRSSGLPMATVREYSKQINRRWCSISCVVSPNGVGENFWPGQKQLSKQKQLIWLKVLLILILLWFWFWFCFCFWFWFWFCFWFWFWFWFEKWFAFDFDFKSDFDFDFGFRHICDFVFWRVRTPNLFDVGQNRLYSEFAALDWTLRPRVK